MSGGDGPNGNEEVSLVGAQQRIAGFTHLRYDITDRLSAFVEGLYAKSDHDAFSFPGWEVPPQTFTIFSGNPYIPASIQTRMNELGLASFPLGRLNRDFARTYEELYEETTRFVVGLTGGFGDGWVFDMYYTYGRNDHHLETSHDIHLMNLYRASDAVVDPATGRIVCNMTLLYPTATNPDIRNCVPINLFGEGSPSAAAASYVTGTEIDDTRHRQDVAAISVRGEPFSTWAGPVSVAFGAEYRKESAHGPGDPIANTACTNIDVLNGPGFAQPNQPANPQTAVIRSIPASLVGKPGCWILSNIAGIEGSFDIREGFVESLIPLASDKALAKSLDLNVATRYADYNLSGGVQTWKAGLVYQPIDDLRLRGTLSRDIRAGNITQLFALANNTGLTVSDPFRGGEVSSGGNTNTIGNPDLEPEEADTTTFGVTYRPNWLPGLAASVDWFNIDIKGAITALGAQNIVNQCFAGATELCALIRRNADGIIDLVINPTLNAQSVKVRGVDVETSYYAPASDLVSSWNGELGLRLLATYISKLETALPGVAAPIDRAGDVRNGSPRWKATLTANYTNGPLSFSMRERYVGGGVYDSTFIDGITIDNNDIPARFYTDFTVRYKIGVEEKTELFFTVNNVFDQIPPKSGNFQIVVTQPLSRSLYDSVLRAFVTGVTFQF
jgi:outer membrane receptor protein involved in Fe transport